MVGTLIRAWPEWRVEVEEPSLSRRADHLGEGRSAKKNTIRPAVFFYQFFKLGLTKDNFEANFKIT